MRGPWIIAAAAVLLIYGVFPRGYVRGALVFVPAGREPVDQSTQWRLAPPRWLSRVPYPYWTAHHQGGEYTTRIPPKLSSGTPGLTVEVTRCRWFDPPTFRGGLTLLNTSDNPGPPETRRRYSLDYARSMLNAQVRRQCEGRAGIFGSPDDREMPAGLKDSFDPW